MSARAAVGTSTSAAMYSKFRSRVMLLPRGCGCGRGGRRRRGRRSGGLTGRRRRRFGRLVGRDLRDLAVDRGTLLHRRRLAALLVAAAIDLRGLALAGAERLAALRGERVL